MSAIGNAKAVLRELDRDTYVGDEPEVAAVLRALLAEHERVLAERAAPQEQLLAKIKELIDLDGGSGDYHDQIVALLAEAERDLATCGMNCYLVRRGMTNPGPWEPLPEDANQTNERSKR